jgi:CRP-like cAMP-binding protein
MSGSDRLDQLRGVPLLADLGAENLARIAEIATEFEAPENLVLIEVGQVGSGMFILKEGEVVVELKTGEVYLGPGDYFGEMALLSASGRRTARVRTLTPVRCLAIGRADFTALIQEEPRLGLVMLPNLARRLAAMESPGA